MFCDIVKYNSGLKIIDERIMPRAQQLNKQSAGKNVNLRDELYEKLRAYTKQSNLEIKDFVNSVVEETLDRYEHLKQTYPDLRVVDARANGKYVIADVKEKALATVSKKDDLKWHCDICRASDCTHATFAAMLPRMEKLSGMFVRLLRDSDVVIERAD